MTRAVIHRARPRPARGRCRSAAALGAAAVATVALLAGPSVASANDTTCSGFTRLDKAAAADNQVDYRFRCSAAIAGYSVVSVDEVASFATEGVVQDPMTLQALNDESYSCEGLLPGNGQVCNGKAGQAHVVSSSIDTDKRACSTASNFYLTVADANGAPAGVFALGRPRGCPHATRVHRSRKAAHRSRR